MMHAPKAPDEARRLRALRECGVLDSPPEESFDRLTALAAHLCDAPIALISLVDEDRQWFKSRVGMTEQESARDISFCGHCILGEDLMVVPDAREDERFADNPFVLQNPGIRFYAGAPLRTRDGHTLGSLCVIDQRPRRLELRQVSALRSLARHTACQLEVRRYQQRVAHAVDELAETCNELRAERDELAGALWERTETLGLAFGLLQTALSDQQHADAEVAHIGENDEGESAVSYGAGAGMSALAKELGSLLRDIRYQAQDAREVLDPASRCRLLDEIIGSTRRGELRLHRALGNG